jgi:hypothetical protein
MCVRFGALYINDGVVLVMTDRIYVNMERITVNGISETTGWPYAVGENVSALLDKPGTWFFWREYRLAYGVQGRGRAPPTQLQWTRKISREYDPTMQEFFTGVSLGEGETYYLLISKLDPGLRNLNRSYWHEKEEMWRLRALYPLKPAGNEHAMKDVKPRVVPDIEGGGSGEGDVSRKGGVDRMNDLIEQLKFMCEWCVTHKIY